MVQVIRSFVRRALSPSASRRRPTVSRAAFRLFTGGVNETITLVITRAGRVIVGKFGRQTLDPRRHIADQEHRGDRHQHNDEKPHGPGEPARPGVAEVVLGKQVQRAHGLIVILGYSSPSSPVTRMPAKRSSSGPIGPTNDCASSKSSVGHTFCWRASGTANQNPSGSTCVAWARRASSRISKNSPHGTRVVARWPLSSRLDSPSSSQRFIHSV